MKEHIVTETEVPAFFEKQGLQYLRRTVVKAPEVLSYRWKDGEYYLANQEEFVALSARYEGAIVESALAPLFLRLVSDEIGWGVFAAQDLEEGEFLGEYTGYLIPAQESPPDQKHAGRFLSDFSWNYPDELPDGSEFEISALHAGNGIRFVNHSFAPNSTVDHTLVDGIFITFFRTLRSVRKNEQILVDYGEEYWSGGFRELVLL